MPMEDIIEASIDDLAQALSSGQLTTVDLVAKSLLRVSTYDCRNTLLNAIPLINQNVFDEAAAADSRRAKGQSRGVLDGIPFTVKDSYKVTGMTVASGADAFENLVANEDAFLVQAFRDAGAVLIGKTNMCPMAYGGMLRGVYGRAESPYNPDYLAAAFGSGSSNGSGVAITSSFASFGLGGETVSSGRSPGSNNALVVYTPSRGLVSLRGTWPLYPTCDVAIPHTRSMDDLLAILDVLTQEDPTTTGDFWRDQPFLSVPVPWQNPPVPFTSIKDTTYLKGKRIAVPQMYIEQTEDGPYVSEEVTNLWTQTLTSLESAGAIITITPTFPAVSEYETHLLRGSNTSTDFPINLQDWNRTERGILIANAWEDFLQSCSSGSIPSLKSVDHTKLFPQLPRSNPQVKFTEPANAVQWSQLASYISSRPPTSTSYPSKSPIYDIPHLSSAMHALENMRKIHLEKWMDSNEYDFIAFPAAGDVAPSNADIDEDSARIAWTDGVKYSHGNRAIRHLGIPSVTVPMGVLEGKRMPMGLTILGKGYHDENVLRVAWAFEKMCGRGRVVPGRVPRLETDRVGMGGVGVDSRKERVQLEVGRCVVNKEGQLSVVSIKGKVGVVEDLRLEIYVDGKLVEMDKIKVIRDGDINAMHFECEVTTASPPEMDERNKVVGKIARDSTMVMILARDGATGWPAGYIKLVHISEQ